MPPLLQQGFEQSSLQQRGTQRHERPGGDREMPTAVSMRTIPGKKGENSRRKAALTVFGLVRFLASVSQLLRWLYVLLLWGQHKEKGHRGSRHLLRQPEVTKGPKSRLGKC